jgi:hypothetical protein
MENVQKNKSNVIYLLQGGYQKQAACPPPMSAVPHTSLNLSNTTGHFCLFGPNEETQNSSRVNFKPEPLLVLVCSVGPPMLFWQGKGAGGAAVGQCVMCGLDSGLPGGAVCSLVLTLATKQRSTSLLARRAEFLIPMIEPGGRGRPQLATARATVQWVRVAPRSSICCRLSGLQSEGEGGVGGADGGARTRVGGGGVA